MYEVVGFYTVLDEEIVSLDIIAHIVLDCEEVDSVKGDDSCHGVVDCVAADEGVRDIAVHMEVNAVAADDDGLTTVEELSISNVCN